MERNSITLSYDVSVEEGLEICAKFGIVPEVTAWNKTPIPRQSLTIELPQQVTIEYWVKTEYDNEWHTFWDVVFNESNELVAERNEKKCL